MSSRQGRLTDRSNYGTCSSPKEAPAGNSWRVAGLGPTLPAVRVRETRQDDHPLPAGHPQHPDHGLSNARAEATNTHLRVLTRRSYGFQTPQALIAMAMLTRGSYGFQTPQALIAMAMLTRGGLCPELPGRELAN